MRRLTSASSEGKSHPVARIAHSSRLGPCVTTSGEAAALLKSRIPRRSIDATIAVTAAELPLGDGS